MRFYSLCIQTYKSPWQGLHSAGPVTISQNSTFADRQKYFALWFSYKLNVIPSTLNLCVTSVCKYTIVSHFCKSQTCVQLSMTFEWVLSPSYQSNDSIKFWQKNKNMALWNVTNEISTDLLFFSFLVFLLLANKQPNICEV